MKKPCPLEVSQEQVDAFKECEAVLLVEFELDGKRVAKVGDWGKLKDMEARTDEYRILAVPPGTVVIAQRAIAVADLLDMPEKES